MRRPELPAKTKEKQQRWRLWWWRRQAEAVPLLLLLLPLSLFLLPRLSWLQLSRSGRASWQGPCAWEEEGAPPRKQGRRQGRRRRKQQTSSSPLSSSTSACPPLQRRRRRRWRSPLLPLFPPLLPLFPPRSPPFSSLERRAERAGPWACVLQRLEGLEGPSLSALSPSLSSAPASFSLPSSSSLSFSLPLPVLPRSSSSLLLWAPSASVSAAPGRPPSWSRPSSSPQKSLLVKSRWQFFFFKKMKK